MRALSPPICLHRLLSCLLPCALPPPPLLAPSASVASFRVLRHARRLHCLPSRRLPSSSSSSAPSLLHRLLVSSAPEAQEPSKSNQTAKRRALKEIAEDFKKRINHIISSIQVSHKMRRSTMRERGCSDAIVTLGCA
ncbi:hypothetical protein Fmac_012007 [Flemingia macrophylla]|uniref:Uncharacterized protein n=1 Tax=Flemingia macrophylla TaxID=520843 RepID=A0ABD1MPG6_9FABA